MAKNKLTKQDIVLRALKKKEGWHASSTLLAAVRRSYSSPYGYSWYDAGTVSSAISSLRRKGETIESKREGDKWSYRWVPPRVYTQEEISDVKKQLRKMIKDLG